MKIEYSLDKSDFLTYQLYAATKSKNIKKNRRNARLIPPVFFIIVGIYLSFRDNSPIGLVIFFVLSVLWFIFYPKYQKYKYEKHYKKHIDENYANRINISTTIEFDKEYITSINKIGKSKIKTSEIRKMIELKNHFLFDLLDKQALIIPKIAIEDIESFKTEMRRLNISNEDKTNWEWK